MNALAHSERGRRARRGVTLLELLIVVSLVSLLLGAGVGVLANLNVGKRAAHGLVANVVRSAANSAVARQAPARVRVDPAERTITADALKVVGTWHFESEALEGAFGLDGRMAGAAIVDDGWIGRAISFAGTSRPAYAEMPVELDPAFDLAGGFAIDCSVRIEERGTGSLVDVGGAVGLELVQEGVLRAWLRPEVENEQGRPSRGSRILVDSTPGALGLGAWRRVSATYDRTHFTLAIDGLAVGAVATDAPVWALEGPLHVGDSRRGFPGSLDALAVSAVAASARIVLPEEVEFGAESARLVRFAPGGHLDRALHGGPAQILLDYPDGAQELVRIGLYGTVE